MQMGTHLKNLFIRPTWLWEGSEDRKKKRALVKWLGIWNIPILAMGFLLGRATILEVVSPFALAYLAVIYHLARKQWPWVMLALIAGSATLGAAATVKLSGALFLWLVFQKGLDWLGKGQINYAPFVVGATSIVVHLFEWFWEGVHLYQGFLFGVDVLLSFVLTFIFVQSLPLFTVRRKKISLSHEEVVCLVILIGSVMTGTMGFYVMDLSVVHILSRYVVLSLALIGGGMLGAAMGVVMGIILSLSHASAVLQISLLAFSGLLAGLFKEGKRFGVAIGFLLGSTILTLYDGGASVIWMSLMETVIAIFLFLITPSAMFQRIAEVVPGTEENQLVHQEHIKRLRNVMVAKVEQFQELFRELALSFKPEGRHRKEDEEQVNFFLSEVMDQACLGCQKFQNCWEKQVVKTYSGMTNLMTLVETVGTSAAQVPISWQQHCLRADRVLAAIKRQYHSYEQMAYLRDQMRESKRLVSEQLSGMAEVMQKLATEIRHETQVMSAQEEQIREALEELGLSIQRVDIINLEEGKVEIELMMPQREGVEECKRLIVPLLTEILGEPISVYKKEIKDRSSDAIITLVSAQRYELKTGVATAAKGGGLVSGDSYCYMNLGTGKYAVALSDGMGNGSRAQEESSAALKLLKRLLQAGMSEDRAVEIVNSILSLRSTDEIFATVDLAMVDLNTAKGRFMKIGSTPGFIKRGNQVFTLSAANPPIGILQEIEVETIEMQLLPGDLIILMTDGIYDAPRYVTNKDAWMMSIISEIETKDPQDFADCLLEKVVRLRNGQILDDMTVVVSKVERHAPEWSTIRLPGTSKINRSKAVS